VGDRDLVTGPPRRELEPRERVDDPEFGHFQFDSSG